MNGLEAVNYVRNRFEKNKEDKFPKVIIMDIDMPVMDGIQASDIILQFAKEKDSS